MGSSRNSSLNGHRWNGGLTGSASISRRPAPYEYRSVSSVNQESPWPRIRSHGARSSLAAKLGLAWLFVFGVTAMGLTSYLAWAAATSSPVWGCGQEGLFQCGHVMQSRWAKWFSVPVTFLALPVYGALLGSVIAHQRSTRLRVRQWTRYLIHALALSVVLSALWFLGLQVVAIKHLCIYCVGIHLCGLALAGVVFALWPISWRQLGSPAVVAALGLSCLVVGQWSSAAAKGFQIEHYDAIPADEPSSLFEAPGRIQEPPRPGASNEAMTYSPLASGNWLHLLTGVIHMQDTAEDSNADGRRLASFTSPATRKVTSLDSRDWPRIGRPDADLVIIEMFDYTCSHCRRTQTAIRSVLDKYPDQLAVIVLPVPMNTQCNSAIRQTNPAHADACEIARLSLAVWRVNAEQFPAYHEWLLAEAHSPGREAARAEAERLVGKDELAAELDRPLVRQFIDKHVELYQRSGAGTIPKILFPRQAIVGELTSTAELDRLIRSHLNNR